MPSGSLVPPSVSHGDCALSAGECATVADAAGGAPGVPVPDAPHPATPAMTTAPESPTSSRRFHDPTCDPRYGTTSITPPPLTGGPSSTVDVSARRVEAQQRLTAAAGSLCLQVEAAPSTPITWMLLPSPTSGTDTGVVVPSSLSLAR